MEVCQSKEECVQAICELPNLFWKHGDLSPVEIVKRARYRKHCEQITNSDIASVLKGNRELIESWIGYSQDQRCTPVWCFEKRFGRYVLGYLSSSIEYTKMLTSSNPIPICVQYIRLNMDNLVRY